MLQIGFEFDLYGLLTNGVAWRLSYTLDSKVRPAIFSSKLVVSSFSRIICTHNEILRRRSRSLLRRSLNDLDGHHT
ncbi:hypothetical protein M413DRAFT_279435 [Hebeloma cylindrosporum]|uniref:Uncharacterized protein n=1 Tax=Hebeloma cylindrosporum TaxID=76867 RepID=A0A0C2Y876_HEBCY|nr:hypothetical protein M413DRAFT_279435 [Hebeloma cylindrosporum h7]